MNPKHFVHETAVIGVGPRFLQGMNSWQLSSSEDVELPSEVYIGPFAVIGYGVKLGERTIIDAYCKLDPNSELGNDSLLIYRGTIGVGARVGANCVIGASVSEATIIEDNCRSFGKLIHTHWDSTMSWDFHDAPEKSPIIRANSFIGHDATVIGGVEVGPNAYICAGATISKTVPPYHIGYGINKIIHFSLWKGQLTNNPIFHE